MNKNNPILLSHVCLLCSRRTESFIPRWGNGEDQAQHSHCTVCNPWDEASWHWPQSGYGEMSDPAQILQINVVYLSPKIQYNKIGILETGLFLTSDQQYFPYCMYVAYWVGMRNRNGGTPYPVLPRILVWLLYFHCVSKYSEALVGCQCITDQSDWCQWWYDVIVQKIKKTARGRWGWSRVTALNFLCCLVVLLSGSVRVERVWWILYGYQLQVIILFWLWRKTAPIESPFCCPPPPAALGCVIFFPVWV